MPAVTDPGGEAPQVALNRVHDSIVDLMDEDCLDLSIADAQRLREAYYEAILLIEVERRALIRGSEPGIRLYREFLELERAEVIEEASIHIKTRDRWVPLREDLRTVLLHLYLGVELV